MGSCQLQVVDLAPFSYIFLKETKACIVPFCVAAQQEILRKRPTSHNKAWLKLSKPF